MYVSDILQMKDIFMVKEYTQTDTPALNLKKS